MERFENRIANTLPVERSLTVCEVGERRLFERCSDLLHRSKVCIAVWCLVPVTQAIEAPTWGRRPHVGQIEIRLPFEEQFIWILGVSGAIGLKGTESTVTSRTDRLHDVLVSDLVTDFTGMETRLSIREYLMVGGHRPDLAGGGRDRSSVGQ